MNVESGHAPIGRGQRCAVLLVPWTFIVLFCALYVEFLLPRMRDGHAIGAIVGVISSFVLIVFVIAAVTFSRDVVTGRWP